MIAFDPSLMEATGNPYLGLRPFRPEHANLYFGREEQVAEMLGCLERGRFLALVGESGVGKSSLVAAGLFPELMRGAVGARYRKWTTVRFQPGLRPMHGLAAAVSRAAGNAEGAAALESSLFLSSLGLTQEIRRLGWCQHSNVLLFCDQFE